MKALEKRLRHLVTMRHGSPSEEDENHLHRESEKTLIRLGRQLLQEFHSEANFTCCVFSSKCSLAVSTAQTLARNTNLAQSAVEVHPELTSENGTPNVDAAFNTIMANADKATLMIIVTDYEMLMSLPRRFGRETLDVDFERQKYGPGGGCMIDCRTGKLANLSY